MLDLLKRFTTASAALTFVALIGGTGVEVHLASCGAATPNIAVEAHGSGQTANGGQAGDHTSGQTTDQDHAGHHGSGHPHGGTQDCTCVGPCNTGAAPTLPVIAAAVAPSAETYAVRSHGAPTTDLYQDPTAYLLPLRNPPPTPA